MSRVPAPFRFDPLPEGRASGSRSSNYVANLSARAKIALSPLPQITALDFQRTCRSASQRFHLAVFYKNKAGIADRLILSDILNCPIQCSPCIYIISLCSAANILLSICCLRKASAFLCADLQICKMFCKSANSIS